LIIEVDGGVHISRETQDRERERALEELGYRVIRFTNNEVEWDMDQVVEAIRAALDIAPHPRPSP
jgi:very-short-patch-repair endonuclease